MKVILAYDGSECADKAIEGLRFAGIPDGSDVTVVSVSEWFPVPVAVGGSDVQPERPPGNGAEAARLAEVAAQRLKEEHPTWTVGSEGFAGSPAREIVRCAEEKGAELIITGSHGRSAMGRFFLGSVSHQILTSSRCSVRISRDDHKEGTAPLSVLVALDGSDYAQAISEGVLHRSWPAETTFTIVSAAEYSYDQNEEEETMEHLERLHAELGEKLKEKGYAAESIIDTGMVHPREVILREAKRAGASCIFLGARGLTRFERFVLGSVSTAVAMRAECSVEIVHHSGERNS